MDEIIWNPDGCITVDQRRRLALCEAVLAQISTGVAVLAPCGDGDPALELIMVNEVAAVYFGWLGPLVGDGPDSMMVHDAFEGLQNAGIVGLAELVSLTGHEHTQEAVAVPGAMAAGHRIDVSIAPADDAGAVVLTFVDVTHQVRPPISG